MAKSASLVTSPSTVSLPAPPAATSRLAVSLSGGKSLASSSGVLPEAFTVASMPASPSDFSTASSFAAWSEPDSASDSPAVPIFFAPASAASSSLAAGPPALETAEAMPTAPSMKASAESITAWNSALSTCSCVTMSLRASPVCASMALALSR